MAGEESFDFGSFARNLLKEHGWEPQRLGGIGLTQLMGLLDTAVSGDFDLKAFIESEDGQQTVSERKSVMQGFRERMKAKKAKNAKR